MYSRDLSGSLEKVSSRDLAGQNNVFAIEFVVQQMADKRFRVSK